MQVERATGDAVARNARAVLANASYRSRMEVHRVNLTTGERQQHWNQTGAIDRVDRRGLLDTRVRADGGVSREITYVSETRTAFYSPVDASERVPVHERFARRQAGDWTVLTLPGYRTLVDDVLGSGLPDLDGYDLAVRERTDDRVVLAATRRPDDDPPEDGQHLLVGHVRMVVDADTGRPLGVRQTETFRAYEDGTTERYRVVTRWTYADYGDPDVAAPDAIGPRGPVEWLWDYVYY